MSLEEKILKLLDSQQYSECLKIVKLNPEIPFTKVLFLSKVYKGKKTKKRFWQSDLILIVCDDLLNSEEKIDFFYPYFSFKVPVNLNLLKKIWNQDSSLFTSLFKRFKCYKNLSWIEALKTIALSSHKRLDIELLIYQSQLIKELEEATEAEEREDYRILSSFPIDVVLLGFCFVHEGLMQDDIIMGNDAYKTTYDMAIARVLDGYLKFKNSLNNNTSYNIKYKKNSQLQKTWEYFRPKHKTEIFKQTTFEHNDVFLKIYMYIERGITRLKKQYIIESFSAEMCDFGWLGLSSINYNNKHYLFRKNDSKARNEESYFIQTTLAKSTGIREKEFTLSSLYKASLNIKNKNTLSHEQLALGKTLSIFKLYNIPLNISSTNIDISFCYKILVAFSWYKSPESNTYLTNDYKESEPFAFAPNERVMTITHNKPPKDFSKFFGRNAAIYVLTYEKLIYKIHRYFKKPLSLVKEHLDFLIFDIESENKLTNWFHRPFIKIKDQVYWLGRILKDRRWDVLLREKLKSDKSYADSKITNAFVQTIDKNLEVAISNIFKNKAFQCITGLIFPNPHFPNKQGGDIDVLAYRDKYLFVIQVKNGSMSDQIRQASYIEDKQLMNQATKQLDNSIEFITNNWLEVRKEFDIENNIDDITIYPLIVTNVYQGDMKEFRSYKKVSLFELYIIMNNLKKPLYHAIASSHNTYNSHNPEYKSIVPILDKNLDLWDGKESISPKILINCIENDSVWKELDEIRDFS